MKNKIWSVLLSFVIALGLWTYVITVVSPGSDAWFYRVPINLRGEQVLQDRGLMIVSTANTTTNLHLEGNRSELSKVDSSNITLEADLSVITEPGTYTLRHTTPTYPVGVNALTVLSSSSDSVTVVVAKRVSKDIRVEVELTGSIGQDYYADAENINFIDAQANLVPESSYTVRITGPEDVVEQIDHAYLEVDMTGRTATVDETLRYTLLDENNEPVDATLIEVSVEEVRVQVKVLMHKTVPLTLNVIDGAGATEGTSQIVIDPVTLSVAGREEDLEKLTEVELGTVNLKDITDDSWSQEFTIVLPEGITNLTGESVAKVTITFPDLATKEITVTNPRAVNIPEGLEVTVQTKQLVITLRGPKAQIEKISASDLDVSFDLTGAQLGDGVYAAIVVVGGQYPNVGVLSAGQISATLSEPVTTVSPVMPSSMDMESENE